MKFQLDTAAMNALFPEGSEARVELQKAVIANFARKMHDKHVDEEVRSIVREVVQERGSDYVVAKAIRAELDKHVKQDRNSWWNPTYSIGEESKIRKTIKDFAGEQAHRIMMEACNDSKELVNEHAEAAKGRLIDFAANVMVKAENDLQRRLEQKVSAKLDELIRLEFAKIMAAPGPLVGK